MNTSPADVSPILRMPANEIEHLYLTGPSDIKVGTEKCRNGTSTFTFTLSLSLSLTLTLTLTFTLTP